MPEATNCANMPLNINSEAKNTEICSSDDHITSLIQTMEFFFIDQQLFCDVALIAENDDIKLRTHRMVLSAASKYFLAMFTGSLREANESEVTIQKVSSSTLKSVINFIYTGSIELSTDTVEDILKTAHLFQLNSLQEVCCNYIIKQLDSSNCIGIALFAELYDLKTLYDTAALFVCHNFMNVCHDKEFFQLDNNQLGRFLSSDDLHVPSEEDVFRCMMSWVDCDRAEREQFIDKLLAHLRFPLLLPKFIADTVKSVCKSTESLRLITKAFEWHAIPDLDHRLSLFTDEQMQMRYFKNMIVAISGLRNSNALLSVGYYYAPLNKWIYRECQGLAEGRTSFGWTTLDGKFIIAGGYLPSGQITDRVDCLDLKTLKWSELPRMSTPRSSFEMVTLKGQVYAVGGNSDVEERNFCSVETYDPVALEWKFVTNTEIQIGYQIRAAACLNSLYFSTKDRRSHVQRFLHYAYDTVAKTWNNNWPITNGDLLGTGTVRILSTNYYLAVSQTNIAALNLKTNLMTTVPMDDIPSEYTKCLVFEDRIIVYGEKKILDCTVRNMRKAIPDFDTSSSDVYLTSYH